MPEFAFDLTLAAALRVNAPSEAAARKLLREVLTCADSNLGAWPDGQPILAELTADPESFALYEIDGETPDPAIFPEKGERLFADGERFRIFENPANGWRVVRLADGEQAVFQGDDRCETFRDHFAGDEFPAPDATESAAEADEFGAWCETNGELPPLTDAVDWETVARREGWEVVEADPNPMEGQKIEPCLYHRNLDRVWPLDDWEGAARDLGIGDDGTYGDEEAAA